MDNFAQNIIRKYGSKITITYQNKVKKTKGIINPLYKNNKNISNFKRTALGIADNRHFLLILPCNIKLQKTGGEIIECKGKKYRVNSNGTYMIGEKEIYVWAVLTACTDPLEADYDGNN